MGLTIKEALKRLKLSGSPELHEIKTAYEKMIRRYPPEFHPERFQQIEEAYTYLTSLSFMLEMAEMHTERDIEIVFPKPPSMDKINELCKVIERERLLRIIFNSN